MDFSQFKNTLKYRPYQEAYDLIKDSMVTFTEEEKNDLIKYISKDDYEYDLKVKFIEENFNQQHIDYIDGGYDGEEWMFENDRNYENCDDDYDELCMFR